MQRFVVVLGGSAPDRRVACHLPADAFVIAADSGLDHCGPLGLTAALVVGDLDSVTEAALAAAVARGTPVERHPPAKDATDAELAIAAATARGARRLTVVTGGGDRLDHVVGELGLLTHPALAGCDVDAWIGRAYLRAVQGPGRVELSGPPGAYVSIVAAHGEARGVTTVGLRYPLHDEPLLAGSTRGLSNEFLSAPASVSVREGALLVIVPDGLEGEEGQP